MTLHLWIWKNQLTAWRQYTKEYEMENFLFRIALHFGRNKKFKTTRTYFEILPWAMRKSNAHMSRYVRMFSMHVCFVVSLFSWFLTSTKRRRYFFDCKKQHFITFAVLGVRANDVPNETYSASIKMLKKKQKQMRKSTNTKNKKEKLKIKSSCASQISNCIANQKVHDKVFTSSWIS